MFIVQCFDGSQTFYLATSGNWTVDIHRAAPFATRMGAYKARCRAYKTKRDRITTIQL